MARTKNAIPVAALDSLIALSEDSRKAAISGLSMVFGMTADAIVAKMNKHVEDTAGERERNALLATLNLKSFGVDMVLGRLSAEVSDALKDDPTLRFVLTTRWDSETNDYVMVASVQAARGRKAADSDDDDSDEAKASAKASKRK